MKFFFLLTLIFVIPICPYSVDNEHCDIDSILTTIPEEDKSNIEQFWRHQFAFNLFGHVMFGSKPMVWGDIDLELFNISFTEHQGIKYNPIKHQYKAWKKYKHLFPTQNYILKVFDSNDGYRFPAILFINKKACLNVIQKNIRLFKRILGNLITPKEILHRLETNASSLEALNGSHALLGIVLGFGTHNSIEYQKWSDLWDICHPPYDFKLLEALFTKSIPFPEFFIDDLSFLDLPIFGEDCTHPESIEIREDYLRKNKVIREIYVQKDFLKTVLNALTERE